MPARESYRQRLALHELQHEERGAGPIFEPVDSADVRMIKRGEDLGFPVEAREAVGIERELRRQDLEGDIPIQFRVIRGDRRRVAGKIAYTARGAATP